MAGVVGLSLGGPRACPDRRPTKFPWASPYLDLQTPFIGDDCSSPPEADDALDVDCRDEFGGFRYGCPCRTIDLDPTRSAERWLLFVRRQDAENVAAICRDPDGDVASCVLMAFEKMPRGGPYEVRPRLHMSSRPSCPINPIWTHLMLRVPAGLPLMPAGLPLTRLAPRSKLGA